jgi:hypothetical protein
MGLLAVAIAENTGHAIRTRDVELAAELARDDDAMERPAPPHIYRAHGTAVVLRCELRGGHPSLSSSAEALAP